MSTIISRLKSLVIGGPQQNDGSPSVNLTKMGYLYITAALFQCIWPYLIWMNEADARRLVDIPYLGWACVAIWLLMLWSIPHLVFIGLRLISISRNQLILIYQTTTERKRMGNIALILSLGVLLDIVLLPLMFDADDKGIVIILSVVLGGRIARGNLEAVMQYHRW